VADVDRDRVAAWAGCSIESCAVVAARARVGHAATVGAGATILPDRSVGAGAVVRAGAVVTRDVSAGAVAAGVPAQSLERGWGRQRN
jgi:acetyltransferase-like isoleucine patch superfamily enzyme